MAKAGIEGAILNVKINLGSIKDEEFVKNVSDELDKLKDDANKKLGQILDIVNKNL